MLLACQLARVVRVWHAQASPLNDCQKITYMIHPTATATAWRADTAPV